MEKANSSLRRFVFGLLGAICGIVVCLIWEIHKPPLPPDYLLVLMFLGAIYFVGYIAYCLLESIALFFLDLFKRLFHLKREFPLKDKEQRFYKGVEDLILFYIGMFFGLILFGISLLFNKQLTIF